MTAKATPKRQRGGRPRAIATTLPRITQAAFGKRGFPGGAIVNDWPLIAGEHLARHSAPERIDMPRSGDGGTLHLRIDNGALATELQHLEPLLIERINGHFGYRAVARLKITQGPLPAAADKPAEPAPPALSDDDEKALAESLGAVDDPDLKGALDALGRAVKGRQAG